MQRIEHHVQTRCNRPTQKIPIVIAAIDGNSRSRVHHNAGFLHLLISSGNIQNAVNPRLCRILRANFNWQIDLPPDPLNRLPRLRLNDLIKL